MISPSVIYLLLKKQCDDLEKQVKEHAKTKTKLESKVIDLEARSMRENLLFNGIPESNNEDCGVKVKDFMVKELELEPQAVNDMILDRVHFIDYISKYDIIFLGETWLNNNTSLNCDIQSYETEHLFATKSLGAKKGRYSGGITVYYKTCLKDYIKIVEKSQYGYVWIKIDSKLIHSENDLYICLIY